MWSLGRKSLSQSVGCESRGLLKFYHAAYPVKRLWVIYDRTVQLGQLNPKLKGECEMATRGAWCMALFFVWYGLAAFVPALNTDMFRKIAAVLAVVGGVLSVIGLLGM